MTKINKIANQWKMERVIKTIDRKTLSEFTGIAEVTLYKLLSGDRELDKLNFEYSTRLTNAYDHLMSDDDIVTTNSNKK